MLLDLHPLNQTFLDHKQPKQHITNPQVFIHVNPAFHFYAVLVTRLCVIEHRQLAVVVTGRKHCL